MTLRWKVDITPAAEITATMRTGAELGLKMGAEHILSVSDTRVPLEWGTLAGSGDTSVDYPTAAVTYDTEYAVPQHERLDYRHPNGRQAKYLETAFADSISECRQIIAAQIRRAMR
jgi:hypothetical protein